MVRVYRGGLITIAVIVLAAAVMSLFIKPPQQDKSLEQQLYEFALSAATYGYNSCGDGKTESQMKADLDKVLKIKATTNAISNPSESDLEVLSLHTMHERASGRK